jgi:hypothetical protein
MVGSIAWSKCISLIKCTHIEIKFDKATENSDVMGHVSHYGVLFLQHRFWTGMGEPQGLRDTSWAGGCVDFVSMKWGRFWSRLVEAYPTLTKQTYKVIVLFVTTYLCECGILAIFTIKIKASNKLEVNTTCVCLSGKRRTELKWLTVSRNSVGTCYGSGYWWN